MKLRTIICAGVAFILLIVPPALNWILRSPTPFDTPVVGQPTDWLTFWGAYLGAVLTAAISFVVLYFTQKQNHNTQMIQIQENSIRELENKITSRIEQIDFPQLYQISLKSLSVITVQEIQWEIDRLNSLHSKVSACADTWGVIHEHETSNEAKEFNSRYKECLEGYRAGIDEMTCFLIKQRNAIQNGGIFDVPGMNNLVSKYSNAPAYYDNMYHSASRWLHSEQKQLQDLIEKHKNLF